MLKNRLVPIVLLSGYQLVKTRCFENPRTVGNPIQIIRVFNNRQVDELVFLDIMATRQKTDPSYSLIERIAAECYMPLTVGGGIRRLEDIEHLLKIGADKVAFNTIALEEPEFIHKSSLIFGSQSIVVSVDVRRSKTGWEVYSRCGTIPTGKDVVSWCKQVSQLGAGEILLTSIDCDGMQQGLDINLVRQVSDAINIPLLANGGAGEPEHVVACFKEGRPDAVCASSLFFFTQYSPQAVKLKLKEAGINVRL